MTVDDVRAHLRPLLEREFGVDGAAYLIDRPPGGWSDLVTNRTLERELDALRHELRADMAGLRSDLRSEMAGLGVDLRSEMADLRSEIAGLRSDGADGRADLHDQMRAQTWQFAKLVIAAQGVMVAAIGGIGALLRFA